MVQTGVLQVCKLVVHCTLLKRPYKVQNAAVSGFGAVTKRTSKCLQSAMLSCLTCQTISWLIVCGCSCKDNV